MPFDYFGRESIILSLSLVVNKCLTYKCILSFPYLREHGKSYILWFLRIAWQLRRLRPGYVNHPFFRPPFWLFQPFWRKRMNNSSSPRLLVLLDLQGGEVAELANENVLERSLRLLVLVDGGRSVKQNSTEHAKLHKYIWTNGKFDKNLLNKMLIWQILISKILVLFNRHGTW